MSDSESFDTNESSNSISEDIRNKAISEYVKSTFISFKNGLSELKIKSDDISDYFAEVSFPNTKTRVRLLIKGILVLCGHMFVTTADNPNGSRFHHTILVVSSLLCLCCVAYAITATSFTLKYYSILYVSFILIIMFILISIGTVSSMDILRDVTPHSQIIILIYCVYLIDFEVTVFVCFFISIESLRSEMIQVDLITVVDRSHRDADKLSSLMDSTYESKTKGDRDDLADNYYQLWGRIILWFALNLSGCYLYAISRLRQLSAFRQLGQNVQIRQVITAQKESAMKWITLIMPSEIIPAYMKFIKDSDKSQGQPKSTVMSVFSRSHENVSILFADIVGFTRMSSNKAPTAVVMLLNDLFNRFDILCRETGCEKLGTLGDCYYCVAGCPKPNREHAISCVRMGLGMCLVIQEFNREHREDVNMRVGVHSGRVNAAVIGKQRFRYDVYSYAVIVANEMESSGKPGRVHISQTTYDNLKDTFTVEPGESFEIKKEKMVGIQGMVISIEHIKTYFVIDRRGYQQGNYEATQAEQEAGTGGTAPNVRKQKLNIMTTQSTADGGIRSSSLGDDDEAETSQGNGSIGKKTNEGQEKYDDQALIEAMKNDPEHQADLFKLPPLHPITLNFVSEEIENSYRNQMGSEEGTLTLEAARVAPFLDCVTSTIYVLVFSVSCYMFHVNCTGHDAKDCDTFRTRQILVAVAQLLFCILLTIPLILDLLRNYECVQFYKTFKMRNFRALLFGLMPMVTMLSYFQCFDKEKPYIKKHFFLNTLRLSTFNLFSSLLQVSGSSLVNIGAIIFKILVFVFVYDQRYVCSAIKGNLFVNQDATGLNSCEEARGQRERDKRVAGELDNFRSVIVATGILVALLVRASDFNLRLCFFATNEADRKRHEAEDASQQTQNLLYNIVPKYVKNHLDARGVDLSNASYAVSVENAGVTFACISNFFSSYYREDYKGGESALAALNTIICMFDEAIKDFRHVEKIKTINDCYMVASGLNDHDRKLKLEDDAHLYSLMDYCLNLLYIMQKFNEEYVVGEEHFLLKIGFNAGTVTAGIIGTTKPMYDIWGDTVNVSSRMYSTSQPGVIQVPKPVRVALGSKFKFKRRGLITVKGKGQMKTYLCIGRRQKRKHLQKIP